jgi:hypothetical protein
MPGRALASIPRGTEVEVIYRRPNPARPPDHSCAELELDVTSGTFLGIENRTLILEQPASGSSYDRFVTNVESEPIARRSRLPFDQVLAIRARTSSYAATGALVGAALDLALLGSFFILASSIRE